MKLDAEQLSRSIELNKTSLFIEDTFAKEWAEIEQLDLTEEKANEQFAISIERLTTVSQPK